VLFYRYLVKEGNGGEKMTRSVMILYTIKFRMYIHYKIKEDVMSNVSVEREKSGVIKYQRTIRSFVVVAKKAKAKRRHYRWWQQSKAKWRV